MTIYVPIQRASVNKGIWDTLSDCRTAFVVWDDHHWKEQVKMMAVIVAERMYNVSKWLQERYQSRITRPVFSPHEASAESRFSTDTACTQMHIKENHGRKVYVT